MTTIEEKAAYSIRFIESLASRLGYGDSTIGTYPIESVDPVEQEQIHKIIRAHFARSMPWLEVGELVDGKFAASGIRFE